VYLHQDGYSHIEQLETIFILEMYVETNTVLLVLHNCAINSKIEFTLECLPGGIEALTSLTP
jgi:hypothetical protein